VLVIVDIAPNGVIHACGGFVVGERDIADCIDVRIEAEVGTVDGERDGTRAMLTTFRYSLWVQLPSQPFHFLMLIRHLRSLVGQMLG
jgi:hypothetical protein